MHATIAVDGQAIHMASEGDLAAPPVLLLHGAAFSSETWEKLGTLKALAEADLRAIAIDLPGFARSKQAQGQAETFLAALMAALGLARAVIVAPSMSGRFAFPLLISHPGLVAGFVPVAPVGVPQYLARLRNPRLPALIVWGEADQVVPAVQATVLSAALPGSRVLLMPGARHPCYLDRPAEFHAALIAFAKDCYAAT